MLAPAKKAEAANCGGLSMLPLLPAGFLVTSLALFLMGLLPLSDGPRFVVVHLLVHAHAIFAGDGRCRARLTLAVIDALVDPFDVVGIHLLCRRRRDGEAQDKCGSHKQASHDGAPF